MARKPRVVLVVNTDWFFVSHRLAIGKALRDAGCDVLVGASESDARAKIEDAGLRFTPLPFEPGSRDPRTEVRVIRALTSLYARQRPDVVHHVTIKPVLYGSMVARSLRVPAIINAVSGLGYVFIDDDRPPVHKRALKAAVRAAYRIALGGENTRTIFQNPDDMRLFIDGGIVSPAHTVLIRGSGVDLARFIASPLPEGPPVVVLPARMLWDKGVGEFVAAARLVKRELPEARLVLVGGNDSQNPTRIPTEKLREWTHEGVVEWWGHRADMERVFREAHLVVLPSYREGFPLALAEASASGRASITTDCPGCREAVRVGRTGWLVPPRNVDELARAILTAIRDRKELERRGAEARRYAVEELSIERVVSQTLDVYSGLIGTKLTPAGGGVADSAQLT